MKRKPIKPIPEIGDRVSGVDLEADNDRRWVGWLASPALNTEDPIDSTAKRAIVELDPKYGGTGHEGVPDRIAASGYSPKRKGDHYFFLDEIRLVRKWVRSIPEKTNYRVHKARKAGSVKVGDVWITPREED